MGVQNDIIYIQNLTYVQTSSAGPAPRAQSSYVSIRVGTIKDPSTVLHLAYLTKMRSKDAKMRLNLSFRVDKLISKISFLGSMRITICYDCVEDTSN